MGGDSCSNYGNGPSQGKPQGPELVLRGHIGELESVLATAQTVHEQKSKVDVFSPPLVLRQKRIPLQCVLPELEGPLPAHRGQVSPAIGDLLMSENLRISR